jgi:hypothetical protein
VRATLIPPASCIGLTSMAQCFTGQLSQCVPWVTSPNEVGVYQYTAPANGTYETNVTFFLVYPQNGELNQAATQRLLDEVAAGTLSCDRFGVVDIRAASSDSFVDNDDKSESMSTLGVIFGFCIVLLILVAFILIVIRKKRQIAATSQVFSIVKQLESVPDEELQCVYTKKKHAEREAILAEQEEKDRQLLLAAEEHAASNASGDSAAAADDTIQVDGDGLAAPLLDRAAGDEHAGDLMKYTDIDNSENVVSVDVPLVAVDDIVVTASAALHPIDPDEL